ncbi:MAG: ABC transporter ATP-binding protein, partial [Dehalococcoidia bacterium]
MNHDPLVTIQDIHFSYDSKAVLQGLSLDVKRGEVLGLVGPNGAGKTTLLSVVSGTLRPQQGSVCLGGRDLRELRPRDRARLVAVVSQNPVVPRGFTALEMVMMGRNPRLRLLQWEGPRDLEVCRWAMELTNTWEMASRPISSL